MAGATAEKFEDAEVESEEWGWFWVREDEVMATSFMDRASVPRSSTSSGDP